MVLILTLTVCISILGLGLSVAIIEIRDPTADTSDVMAALLSLITGIVGALLGLLAGRATAIGDIHSLGASKEPSSEGQ